ncbi:hypothetical protein L6R53_21985 [Myxococcota bacterium]|nr:hypothetical protein [Myxococcota bacterium]
MPSLGLLPLLLACTRADPDPGTPPDDSRTPPLPSHQGEPLGGEGTDGGGYGSGGLFPGDGGDATPPDEGVPNDSGLPIPTYDCPPPPDDAWVFHAGTVISDQVYYRNAYWENEGWEAIVTGISYVHDWDCIFQVYYNRLENEVKAGERPGEFYFELHLTVPGQGITDWLGEHDGGGGYLYHRDFAAHYLKIGWRDSPRDTFHFVHSLPFGWTDSTVCVGYISPDRLYMTVLWDPADGPYRTNKWTHIDHPIWFDMEIWPSSDELGDYDPIHGDHRSCALTAWGGVTEVELFSGFDWLGQYPGDWGESPAE